MGQEVNSKSWVTWLSLAQFVNFLKKGLKKAKKALTSRVSVMIKHENHAFSIKNWTISAKLFVKNFDSSTSIWTVSLVFFFFFSFGLIFVGHPFNYRTCAIITCLFMYLNSLKYWPLLIINRTEKGVKNILTAGYNGARTVFSFRQAGAIEHTILCQSLPFPERAPVVTDM